MKLKKVILAPLSFAMLLMYSVSPVFASTSINLGKHEFGENENSEIVMTDTFSKIIFTAYCNNGDIIKSYVEKDTKKVYLNDNEVPYSINDDNVVKNDLPINTYTNIDSTPVTITTGKTISFSPLITAGASLATSLAMAHYGVTAASLLEKLSKTAVSSHWETFVNICGDGLIGTMGGFGASKVLDVIFSYDLQRTKGLIYLNGGSVPVTGYRYGNYKATVKVAG